MLFKDVIGQEEAKSRLVSSVNKDRIGHALLFSEQEGNGALALALAYSQFLLCTDRLKNDSCGVCASCKKFNQLTHPDLHFAFPIILSGGANSESNTANYHLKQWNESIIKNPYIGLSDWQEILGNTTKKAVISVNQSHEVIKKISLKAFEGKHKIMVIWLAEKMNNQAANKLLKILEEPPEKTVFILISQKMEEIISTINSRTQLIKLERPSTSLIEESLINKHQADISLARQAAKIAQGNYNLALKLSNPESANAYFDPFVNWMRLCFKKDVVSLVDWSSNIATMGREGQKGFLNFALNIVKQSIFQNYLDEKWVLLMDVEKAFLNKFAAFITGNNIVPIVKNLEESIYHIDRNANSKIIFLDLSLNVAKLL